MRSSCNTIPGITDSYIHCVDVGHHFTNDCCNEEQGLLIAINNWYYRIIQSSSLPVSTTYCEPLMDSLARENDWRSKSFIFKLFLKALLILNGYFLVVKAVSQETFKSTIQDIIQKGNIKQRGYPCHRSRLKSFDRLSLEKIWYPPCISIIRSFLVCVVDQWYLFQQKVKYLKFQSGLSRPLRDGGPFTAMNNWVSEI